MFILVFVMYRKDFDSLLKNFILSLVLNRLTSNLINNKYKKQNIQRNITHDQHLRVKIKKLEYNTGISFFLSVYTAFLSNRF